MSLMSLTMSLASSALSPLPLSFFAMAILVTTAASNEEMGGRELVSQVRFCCG